MITHRLDPLKRERRYARVAAGGAYAIKALKAGRHTPLGMAYTTAVLALEKLRKHSGVTGAQKQARLERICDLVRAHEEKTLTEAELSLAANVAISSHAAELKRVRDAG